ncbi:MAG: putative manganese-dependent inorganic diphosphatase [Blastochloris sp.]|nr:putative manganese-dependent inorganic diphosphatase [Blastochloris sp.]
MPTYVIGHKNPDTDAICSAIGYAHLLALTTMPEAEPARCGELNSRTSFVLEKAGLPSPRLVMDVRPTASQILRREVISASEDETLSVVFERMNQHGLRNIPVLDQTQRMTGLISIMKMLDLLLPGGQDTRAARLIPTNLRRIGQSVNGHFQNSVSPDQEEEFILTVAAMRAEAFIDRLREYPADRILLVVGNRPTVQRPAIEYGVRCLVISGGYELDPELLLLAREKGVTVLVTAMDTATTTLAIKCSKPVIHALTKDFMSFSEKTLISEIQEKVRATPQVLFPVLDAEQKIVGVFSKSDLISPPLTQLILVDHNEFSQAVTGVEHAEVLEVIDHHRLGGNLVTREPIRFINDPLGSTCTIVSRLFRQQGLTPTPSIALCLAAGIISDTLNLSSPTTTTQDREILHWLGTLTPIPLQQFSEDFFSTGSALQVLDSDQIVRADAKEYAENGWKIIAAQVEEQGLDRFWEREKELTQALETLRQERRLDFACLLITDITLHTSLLLVQGHADIIAQIDYPQLSPNLYELEGIVSRKKQLLPTLIRVLHKVSKPGL